MCVCVCAGEQLHICSQIQDDMQFADSSPNPPTNPVACRGVTVNYFSTTLCLGNKACE